MNRYMFGLFSLVGAASAVQAAPPVAVIDAPQSMGVNTRFTIMASRSSDPDGQVTGYLWRVGGGAEVFTDGPSIDVRIPTVGAVEFRLIAIDNQWQLSAPVTARVIARDMTAPVSVIDLPATARTDEIISFDGRRSTDEARIAEYRWFIAGGAPVVQRDPILRQKITTPGRQTVRLVTVDDSGNVSLPVEAVITIASPPVAVVQVPKITGFNLPVTLDASGSTASDGRIVQYRWQIGNAAPVLTTEPTLTRPPFAVGRYEVRVVVKDDQGNKSVPAIATFIVNDPIAPVAVIQAPVRIEAGASILLSGARSSDAGGRITEYRWKIGDETLVTRGSDLSRTFSAPGNYLISLIVIDDSGNESAPAVQKLSVAASPPIRPIPLLKN